MNQSSENQRVGAVAAGERSVAAGRVDGVVVTGDGARVTVVVGSAGFRLEVLGASSRVGGGVRVSRRSPSYLLDAQRQVVPYRSRPIEQEALTGWRDDAARVSLVVVHGPGGQGKTRLVGWLATDSHRQGWVVAQAVDRDVAPGSAVGGGRMPDGPLLVVVDYAERWSVRTLVRMVETVTARPGRVRVVLLSRSLAGFWDAVEPELERCIDLADPITLGGFTEDDRVAAFTEAVEAFQKAQEIPSMPVPLPPGVVGGDDSPLTLHMAALAAVTATDRGEPPPAAGELWRYLLNHERRHWKAVDYPSETIATTVLIAAVFGPATSTGQARTWLRHAHLADTTTDATRLLHAYQRLYPDGPTGPGHMLQPIKPDRFAEDFIGEHLNQPHNAETLAELLTGEQTPPEAVRHGLITLAAAARHPSTQATLFPLLRDRAELATHLSPPLIDAVIQYADTTTAQTVGQRMPHFNSELLRPARDLAHHLLVTLPPNATAATRAHHLTWFGIRLAEAGEKRAALEPARGAVEIYQLLAQTDPSVYLPDLATALNSLGNRLAEIGEAEDALGPAREAVKIRRRLAETEPTTYLPDLATSLNNLGNHLADVEEARSPINSLAPTSAALELAREAVEIYRRLAETEPATYLPNLAMSLNNLGNRLANTGQTWKTAGLEPTREAVEIYRGLAQTEPATYLPNLATALHNLSLCLATVGARTHGVLESVKAALEPAGEAVETYRRLADTEPGAYLPNLATALENLSRLQSTLEDYRAALEPAREAVEIYRRLAETEPAAYLPNLAKALSSLSYRLWVSKGKRAALELTQEAVEIYRRLAEAEPGVFRYQRDLYYELSDLCLSADEPVAQAAYQEKEEIRRRWPGRISMYYQG